MDETPTRGDEAGEAESTREEIASLEILGVFLSVFGIALLVGAVLPMDVAVLRGRGAAAVRLLRPWAVAGFLLAVSCGALLFVTQAGDYLGSPWFRLKMALLAAALLNAALHLRSGTPSRRAALVSLVLWPGVLVAGRMIAYG